MVYSPYYLHGCCATDAGPSYKSCISMIAMTLLRTHYESVSLLERNVFRSSG
ncbi:hypothetical protein F2Q70_00036518 [Brassica cretica]|uniref:Uncharacterized protein n=1 Tax=Brassica cretica TaxID=69181 RepID=A0A8S9JUE6_BRACR|nr:hypothetical protein F2Q70_00036518 [Brassica cretica]